MYIGVDYYPEHWPETRWKKDAGLMKKAGFNVVRLAEFAWQNMEPEEGRFDFGWLDRALKILGDNGISVILGTPTAVMPAWLAAKYPETLSLKKDGTRMVWGVRKDNCFTSGAYRMLSVRITRAMAEHFAGTRNVIGWQTDNEFGGHNNVCHCHTCRTEFQEWLKAKYGTVDGLNRAWGAHFWGQRVKTWSEVVIPVDPEGHNPSACLDWKRFNSWLNVRFQRDQVRVLREVCPSHFVTHNFMGLFKELDYYELAKDLDFVSWDSYPLSQAPEVRTRTSLSCDVMRGLKKKNFWIMEQTAGCTGWGKFGRNPRPGEMRSMCYQHLGHGCDGMLWFRWRTCTAGREQYWHGLLQHDGRPLRRYREAAKIAGEFHRLAKEVAGTTIKSKVAVIYDYDSIWALDYQPCFEGHRYSPMMARYTDSLFKQGISFDIVPPDADLSGYRLVLAPCLYVLPDRIADRLIEYVRKGGVLLADSRLGVKDETSLCHARTLPGKLSGVLGIEIQEYEAIPIGLKYAATGTGDLSGTYQVVKYCDWITTRGAESLAKFDQWHLKSFSVVTRNKFGKGIGWYLGAVVEEMPFYDTLVAKLLADAGVRAAITPPEGVEVCVREGKGRKLAFVLNHTDERKTVTVPAGRTELISGKKTAETVNLDRYGVAVIKLR